MRKSFFKSSRPSSKSMQPVDAMSQHLRDRSGKQHSTALIPRLDTEALTRNEVEDLSGRLRKEQSSGVPQGATGNFGWERSIDNILFHRLPRMRSQSRFAFRQSSVLRRAVARWRTGVLGSGVSLKIEGPEVDGLMERWDEFAKAVDDEGSVSLNEMLNLAVTAIMIDGEFIAHWVRTSKGMRLRIVDAWRLDTWRNETKKGGASTTMGIEHNRYGEITAYHIVPIERDARTAIYLSASRGEAVRLKASEVLYIKNREYPQQTRGIPLLMAMIRRSDRLDSYSTIELDRANLESRKLGFIRRTVEGVGMESDSVAGGADGQDNTPAVSTGDGYTMHYLDDGQDFTSWDTGHPSGSFGAFMDAQMKELAAASEALSTADITGDYSKINFSAGRLAGLHAKEVFDQLRDGLKMRVLVPMFNEWLKYDTLTSEAGAEVMNVKPLFKFPMQPAVQPKEQAMADREAITLRTKSISEVIRESGRDPAEVFAEIASDKETLEAMGLQYPSGKPEKPDKPDKEPKDDDEDDDKKDPEEDPKEE